MNDFNEHEFHSKKSFDPRPEPKPDANPLKKYFRQPGVMIHLPSGGKFMPQNAIEFTASGEVPIYPFKAEDEILFKSPEALINGYALENMIRSCVPAIKCNPKFVSSCDLDVIILSVRMASYGDKMNIDVSCPKCKKEHSFACDIPSILNTVKEVPDEYSVRLDDDIEVFVRPYNLENNIKLQMTLFNETRKIQAAEQSNDPDSVDINQQATKRMAKLALDMATECIMAVSVPGAFVKDRKLISEFTSNIASEWMGKVIDGIKTLNNIGVDKNLPVHCNSCGHEWEARIEFDPTNFFANGS